MDFFFNYKNFRIISRKIWKNFKKIWELQENVRKFGRTQKIKKISENVD